MLKTAGRCITHLSTAAAPPSLTAYPLFRSLPVIDPSRVTSPVVADPLIPTLYTNVPAVPPAITAGPLTFTTVYSASADPHPPVNLIPSLNTPAVASP